MKLNHVVLILFVVLAALCLVAAAPLQVEPPPTEPTPEAGQAPIAPPVGQEPDYAGFIASAGLVLAATAFAKTRLGLDGNYVLLTAFGIVLAVGFYPDIVGLLPEGVALIVDKFVYGILIPFISATGGYDLAMQFGFLKPKTAAK